MLKIETKEIYREINSEEFRRLKEKMPFAKMRQSAKAVNFSLIFNTTASTFAKTSLESSWTEEDCDNYINDNNIRDLFETLLLYKGKFKTIPEVKLLTVATDMKNKFFLSYPNFAKRIKFNIDYVHRNGYLRCYHGNIIRFPEFLLKGEDDDKYSSRHFSGLENDATNYDIQNFESVVVQRAMANVEEYLETNNIDGYICATIHDSIDIYLPKDITKNHIKNIKDLIEKDYEEYSAGNHIVPLLIDGIITDFHGGDIYKKGTKI